MGQEEIESKPEAEWFPIPLLLPMMIEYECPVCRLVEKMTEYLETPMHRHRYGKGKLQTGLVMLRLRKGI